MAGYSNDDSGVGVGFLIKGMWLIAGVVALILFQNWLRTPSLSQQMRNVNTAIWSGETELAVKLIDEILVDHSNWEWAYERRGEAWRAAGQFGRAAVDFSRAIRLKPFNYAALYGRCRAHAKLGQVDNAIADCDAAAQVKPDGGPILLAADLTRIKGDMAAGFDRYRRAAEVWPANGATRFYSGMLALWYLDRPKEAASDLLIAVKEAFEYRSMGGLLGAQIVDGQPVTDLMAPEHAFVPDGLYAIIWKYIAVAQTGGDAAGKIAEDLKELESPVFRKLVFTKFEDVSADVRGQTFAPWPAPIIGFYAGQLTEEALRRRVDEVDAKTRAHLVCESALYRGEFFRVRNDSTAARQRLKEALVVCAPTSKEHRLAARRLALLVH